MTDTIFGKILRGEIPADLVYEDEDCIAFPDISPQAPVHLLVVPRKSIATLNDVQPEDAALIGKLFLVAARLAREAGIAQAGYRTIINCNAAAGQTVFHLHLHVLGGWPVQPPSGGC
ncbi:MAG TPA: histidine triad nucleotide-binding protein [Lamprocystis sp. (in: g-proteobacteria)]|nr:histidine triad nucleotide-binding protein [Lamprocystis sp. (in: g-proteobacteria)]